MTGASQEPTGPRLSSTDDLQIASQGGSWLSSCDQLCHVKELCQLSVSDRRSPVTWRTLQGMSPNNRAEPRVDWVVPIRLLARGKPRLGVSPTTLANFFHHGLWTPVGGPSAPGTRQESSPIVGGGFPASLHVAASGAMPPAEGDGRSFNHSPCGIERGRPHRVGDSAWLRELLGATKH